MKRIFFILGAIFLLGACRQENRYLNEGEGALSLQVSMGETVEVVSRASLADEEIEALKAGCKVRIYEGDKLIRKYSSWSAVPGKIDLATGENYRVRVVSGDSVSAAFDKKFYEGVTPFSITNGETTSVEVKCNIANTLVKVNFGEELNPYLAEGSVSVAVDAENGALDYAWNGENQESPVGYYMLPEGKEYLTCTFTATTKNGKKVTQTDVIESAKSATLYTLTYALSTDAPERPTDEGGSFFTLKVDATPLHIQEEQVGIYRRPVIKVMSEEGEVSTDTPWFVSLNSVVRPVMTLSGSSSLVAASAEGSLLERLGFAGPVNLFSEETVGALQQKGITLTFPSEAEGRQIVMDWGSSWDELLREENIYLLNYTVADENGKQTTLNWQIVVSDMNVQAVEIPRFETWGDRTVLYGEVIEGHTPGAETTYSFQYRKKGEETWSQNLPATLSGQTVKSDVLKGLIPGTTYEYRILEGTKISNIVCEVTTESVFLLDNNSFEYSSRDGDVLRISQDPSNYWWDSGNEGSAKLNKDVTYPDTSIKHSGNQSLKLQSQHVAFMGFGKFAAGNIFTGEFLGTEETYYGILGWGRPCTTRPLALRAWVRYTPGIVDYTETELINNGDTDKGIIYVAVGDWTSDDAAYGSQWPVVVRTLGPKLFNPKDPGTIGYGEVIFTENVGTTETGGMKEVIIPLNYNDYGGTSRIPTHIIIVASASQFGDYYSGSTSSVMWLDDLELIYEESKLPENLR